jgi:hypothetical protein
VVASRISDAVDVEPTGAERRTSPFAPSSSAVATQLRPMRDS